MQHLQLNYVSNGVRHFTELLGMFKRSFVTALKYNFHKKTVTIGRLPNFPIPISPSQVTQKDNNILSYHHETHIKVEVSKHDGNPPMLVGTILATNLCFAPDWYLVLSYLLFPSLPCCHILKCMLSQHRKISNGRFRVIRNSTPRKDCARW